MTSTIHGASIKRIEDPRLIRGEGSYLANRSVNGELWMVPVRADVPHGRVTSIDTSEASTLPGVVAIYTHSDFADHLMPTDAPKQPESTRRPLITDRARFVGDIVAVVVAESPQQARDTADAVWPEYELLEAVIDIDAAFATDAPVLFPALGTNTIYERGTDEIPDLHADADVVVSTRIVHQRVAAIPLETNNALSIPRPDGGIDVWAGTQQVSGHRNTISTALGIDRTLIHVKVPDMGGGFGAKIYCYPEQVLTAAIALRLQRPVRWQETRSENLKAMTHGRAQTHDVEIGATKDGKITSLRVFASQDAGAYPVYGAYMPNFTRRMASGPYDIPRIEFRWRSAVTNTTPVHAYRGAGRPEATVDLERGIDILAAELGMDPAEVRRRNFIRPEQFPHTTATGELYDSGDYEAALERALDLAGYDAVRREQQARRGAADRFQIGLGIGSYVEVTAPDGRKDWGRVEVDEAGRVTIYSGASSHGHSHETTFAQIVARVLKVPVADVAFVQGDTDTIKRGGGTMGSRSMQMAGTALFRAGGSVIEKAKAIVAHAAEASPDDIVQFDDGRIGVAGVPDTGRTLGEIAVLASAADSLPADMEPGLAGEDTWIQEEASFAFGTHVSVAEVDTETGDIRLLHHVAVDDCGTIFNRMVVDGQVHGGIAQGIGQALLEEFRYDEAANPTSGNLTSYLLPTAVNLPPITIDHTETPTTQNALGAKGIGEAGTIGATPAVMNAVLDAVRHLGVRHIDMPLTPAKIWAALTSP
jgi:carbon-monoxide dehydrogenase large subunit